MLEAALETLQRDSISLQPSERLSSKSLSRRATLQQLVNRFYWQIRYGCQNTNCSTPTCLSCRRRLSKAPLRPFTVLGAKTLAAFLVEQENSEQALCPHPPALPESCRSECQAAAIAREQKRRPDDKGTSSADAQSLDGDDDRESQARKESCTDTALDSKFQEKRQKRDFKSITQSLFDTEAWWVLQSINHKGGKFGWTELPPWPNYGLTSKSTRSSGARSKMSHQKSSTVGTASNDGDIDAHRVLSHFSPSNIEALVQVVKSVDPDIFEQQELIKLLGTTKSSTSKPPLSQQAKFWYRYAYQSMVYVLSNTGPLLNSFLGPAKTSSKSRDKENRRSLDLFQVVHCFRNLQSIEGFPQRIFPSLWVALGQAFVSHSDFKVKIDYLHGDGRPRATLATVPATLSGQEAAHVVGVAIAALHASTPVQGMLRWDFVHFRQSHTVNRGYLETDVFASLHDAFDDDQALKLATRMVHVWMVHRAIERLKNQEVDSRAGSAPIESSIGFTTALIDFIESPSLAENESIPYGITGASTIEGCEKNLQALLLVKWLRRVVLCHWDGKADIERSSPVAGALDWLSVLYQNSDRLGLSRPTFVIWRFFIIMDPIETAIAWESSTSDDKINVFSFPFLFYKYSWIMYFRAINHASMRRTNEQSKATLRLMATMASSFHRPGHRVLERMKPITRTFLVLDIRRDSILTDALNQLWRRDSRELRRPLRVQLGMEEGEQGVDAGGIQQEFFRLAMAEAFDPSYGLFTTDATSKMNWFQPGSLEPSYKYELLGLLASLAVYNGLTLPFTFSKVFYMKLLNVPLKNIDDISDGWPELARGFRELLDWKGDDVEQVFIRSFTFEVTLPGGRTLSIDLSKDFEDGDTPTVTDSEPPMVTSENRRAFVMAYMKALVDTSIKEQFNAFRAGFLTILSQKSLSLFSPEPSVLKTLVEGAPTSSTTAAELKRYCKYCDFTPTSDTVVFFWDIVEHEYDAAMLSKLLEFVTSSPRVPVQGVSSMTFMLQENGQDESRLPTSSTCFGTLLLPEYKSKDVLRERLRIAIENSQGFGSI